MIRTVSMNEGEPGLTPLVAALEQEGFTDFTAGALVESFSRHLMVHSDAWPEHGFARGREGISAAPAARQEHPPRIDENGDLLVRRPGKVEVERNRLMRKLGAPSWLDPATRGPRS